jgi:Polyketide cyclase / dehydrase and lipid transport
MSRVVVTRVIPARTPVVWAVFADLVGRVNWQSEVERIVPLTGGRLAVGTRWRETRRAYGGAAVTREMIVTAIDPGRECTVSLADVLTQNQLTYLFAPIDVGRHRGATTASAVVQRGPGGLADTLLAFVMGGFAARTIEGALRGELDDLAAACRATSQTHRGAGAAAA